jgi:hypothetical protein
MHGRLFYVIGKRMYICTYSNYFYRIAMKLFHSVVSVTNFGDMVECQPTECQPAECQPTECQFFECHPTECQLAECPLVRLG